MRKTSICGIVLLTLLLCLESKSENATDVSLKHDSVPPCTLYTTLNFSVLPEISIINKGISTCLWSGIALASVFCNILIIHVIRVNSHMHTTTNYLIVNMALGDFVTTIVATFGALKTILHGLNWPQDDLLFGQYLFCRMGCASFMICMLCSIYSLVAITFDRFLAVTRPLKYQSRSSWTKYSIAGIWLVSFGVAANYVINKITYCTESGKFYCFSMASKEDTIVVISFGFVLTHIVMLALYVAIAYTLCKRRVPGEQAHKHNGPSSAKKVARKVTRMIICILIAFEISWCPVFFGYILPYLYFKKSIASDQSILFFKMLAAVNGISNAIIYAMFNDNFRKAFQETLRLKALRHCFKPSAVSPSSNESSASKQISTSFSTKSKSTTT